MSQNQLARVIIHLGCWNESHRHCKTSPQKLHRSGLTQHIKPIRHDTVTHPVEQYKQHVKGRLSPEGSKFIRGLIQNCML